MAAEQSLVERYVVTSFLEHAGQILLLRRSARVGSYQGRWAGVSGSIEAGRTPLEQAIAEIEEETGLLPEDVRVLASGEPLEVVDRQLGRRWIVHPFRFEVIRPEKLRLDWEHAEARWIAPAEIDSYPTVPGLAEAWRRVAACQP